MQTTILILTIIGAVGFILLYRKRKPSEEVEKAELTDYEITSFDWDIVDLIREYRQTELLANTRLFYLSYTHSLYMANRCKASHDNIENRQATIHPIKIGEVVASGYTKPESIVEAWKNSPLHNECLLNPIYTKIGVSHSVGKDGKIYVTAILSE